MMPASDAKSRFSISVPVLLTLLTLAVTAPLLAFSMFSLNQLSTSVLNQNDVAMVSRARSISGHVDREIAGLISTAGALGTSKSLLDGNLQEFYNEAKVSMKYAHANVILFDRSLQQLLNTRRPYDTALPQGSAPAGTQEVIDHKRVQVSDLFFGKVAKTDVFNVSVPIVNGDETRYVLVITAEPARLKALLDQEELPKDWQIAIHDRAGKLIATTLEIASGETLDFRADGPIQLDKSQKTSMKMGQVEQDLTFARHQSISTGWTTTVWVAQAALEAPFSPMWKGLYAACVLALVLSGVLAFLFSLPMNNLIRQSLAAAVELAKSTAVPSIKTVLAEGQKIEATLAAAGSQLRERQRTAEEGKALLDTLLEHIPEGITIVGGSDMRVIANSKKAVEWISRPEQDLNVQPDAYVETYGLWFPDGVTRPSVQQMPLYRAIRFGESVSEEYFALKRPDSSQIIIEVSVNPVRSSNGAIIGAVSCWRDVTQRMAIDKIVADNERRLSMALTVAGMAIVDFDLRRSVVSSWENVKAVLGVDIEAGVPVQSAMQQLLTIVQVSDRAKLEDHQRQALTHGGSFSGEFRVQRTGDSIAWIEFKGEVIVDELGKPARLLGTYVDISSRKQAEGHLRLVMREMSHRAKNLLTIISAIATQTARHNTSTKDFLEAFSQRIQGLGASHDLLVKSDWTGAVLQELVQSQLAPFGGVDGKRISVSGPPVFLKTEIMQSLGLALHELATNATKYGALSVPDGAIAIVWSIADENQEKRFHMSWREQNGPRVKPLSRKGFGHVIIESSLARVVNGEVKLEFAKTGIVWTIDTLLSNIVAV